MKTCVFPGSFDPITCGHMDLIQRAACIFDHVTVTVMINPSKKSIIPHEERVRMIRDACEDFPNVEVDLWKGLLADYMRSRPSSVILRGIRDENDLRNEIRSAEVNRRLLASVETVFIPASAQWADISSSVIREIASFGGNFHGLVPEKIYPDVKSWLDPNKNNREGK